MKKSFFSLVGLLILLFVIPACEKDDPPDDLPKEENCKDIAEDKSEKWAKAGGEPINITDMLSTFKGSDGNDYVRCMFILEVDDVCIENPANIEVNYQLETTFPPEYDYAVTDLKLEANFWEYHWNETTKEKDSDKQTIPISFLGSGRGSASGEYEVSAALKTDDLYGNIGASIEFVFRVKNPQKPSIPAKVFKSIISSVEIGISYKR